MLTDDEANEMLESNDWAKFSDARELLKKAAYVGAMKEREMHAAGIELLRAEMARAVARAVAEERERTSGAVALAAEYDAWMRFHDAGDGDFRDFLRQLPSPGA